MCYLLILRLQISVWWAQMESNHRPHAYQACALTIWAMSPYTRAAVYVLICFWTSLYNLTMYYVKVHWKINNKSFKIFFSLERRWSSRTFRYGYLVTTSPQSLILPSTTASLRLAHGLRVFPTLMVWRAVCTRPGNVFTAVCWPAITSNSGFMKANFSLQSELRLLFWVLLHLAA